jgi:hypothetical protein
VLDQLSVDDIQVCDIAAAGSHRTRITLVAKRRRTGVGHFELCVRHCSACCAIATFGFLAGLSMEVCPLLLTSFRYVLSPHHLQVRQVTNCTSTMALRLVCVGAPLFVLIDKPCDPRNWLCADFGDAISICWWAVIGVGLKLAYQHSGSTVKECMPANFIHLDGRLRLSRTLALGLEHFFINMASCGCHLRKESVVGGSNILFHCGVVERQVIALALREYKGALGQAEHHRHPLCT